jgi:hypothetical protein
MKRGVYMAASGLFHVDYFTAEDTLFRAHTFSRGDMFITIMSELTTDGLSIQNGVEHLATAIRGALPQERSFMWVQHDLPRHGKGGGFALVFFDWNGKGYSNPDWKPVPMETVAAITGIAADGLSTMLGAASQGKK